MPRDLFAPTGWETETQPRPLWPHQERGLQLLREAIASGAKRIVIQIPTGGGKTRLAAEVVQGALAKGNRSAFTVPYLSLIGQTIEAFEAEGIDAIGVLQGIHERTDRSQPVQVCSVQTLRVRKLPDVRVVLVDEAHIRAGAIDGWMDERPDLIFVGLSATPWRKGMGKRFERLIVAATMKELIAAGRLVPFRVYAPSKPDLSGVRTEKGDYVTGELSGVMSERTLVEDAVQAWKRLGPGNKTLCYAVDVAHAERLQEAFCAAGVDCALILGNTPAEEREAIKLKYHAGKIEVVVSVGAMVAGIDWDVRCISVNRPTKSEALWVQLAGRGTRLAEGKEFCLLLDHAGNSLRLGLPEDIHHDKLDDGKPKTAEQKAREKKTSLPKECPQCGVIKRGAVCFACGFKAERPSGVVVEDGELVEFGTTAAPKEKYTMAQKQVWFSSLLQIADERGYKAGWASNQYREKFKVWPRGLSEERGEPAPEVRSWLIARQIAWAKSKRRRAA